MKKDTRKSSASLNLDIKKIKENARKHVEDGAKTSSYKGNVDEVIALLNASLATEIVCALRYKRHYFTATGIHSNSIASEFNLHAQEELSHADLIAERIVQLGGEPDFSPETLTLRSHADYVPCLALKEMIKENLVAERIAIDTYHALIRYIGDSDPTTRVMLEKILAQEEGHADELSDWLKVA
ncbi:MULTISPECIES: ferritin-like domain-containing protein [unclassified Methylophilus]|uniref:ferritin-like domain-containing protein n=1 Tax=unclassified Methylophilus TaxID=2630143 RepID=UPI001890AB6B|nr:MULTISPECIES: ferritin-like domain-containing protein [unclassified Methylophilus]MBF5038657.1 bacterioferritin [Methylophilus sp. 13]MDF0378817.1 bacterioferritin [Methylophilus sp. YYY-1]